MYTHSRPITNNPAAGDFAASEKSDSRGAMICSAQRVQTGSAAKRRNDE